LWKDKARGGVKKIPRKEQRGKKKSEKTNPRKSQHIQQGKTVRGKEIIIKRIKKIDHEPSLWKGGDKPSDSEVKEEADNTTSHSPVEKNKVGEDIPSIHRLPWGRKSTRGVQQDKFEKGSRRSAQL